jgi:hypothetical protein
MTNRLVNSIVKALAIVIALASALVFLSSSYPLQAEDTDRSHPSDFVLFSVSFKNNVLESEVRWLLRSYGVTPDDNPLFVSQLYLRGDTPTVLYRESSAVISAFQTGGFDQSVVNMHLASNANISTGSLEGLISTDEVLQHKLTLSLRGTAAIELQSDDVIVRCPHRLSKSWSRLLAMDSHVKSTRILPAFEAQMVKDRVGVFNRKSMTGIVDPVDGKKRLPTIKIRGATLPSVSEIGLWVKDFYAASNPKVTVAQIEARVAELSVVATVTDTGGVITKRQWPEVLRYSLVTYADSEGLNVSCKLAGEYTRTKNAIPQDSEYRDLQPKYAQAIRRQVEGLLAFIATKYQRVNTADD